MLFMRYYPADYRRLNTRLSAVIPANFGGYPPGFWRFSEAVNIRILLKIGSWRVVRGDDELGKCYIPPKIGGY